MELGQQLQPLPKRPKKNAEPAVVHNLQAHVVRSPEPQPKGTSKENAAKVDPTMNRKRDRKRDREQDRKRDKNNKKKGKKKRKKTEVS